MMKKLKQNKGETLMEALISLLIAVLAIGLVATASICAANINKNTNLADAAFAEELEEAELYTASNVEVKQLKVKFNEHSYMVINGNTYVDVNVYGDGSIFASYK